MYNLHFCRFHFISFLYFTFFIKINQKKQKNISFSYAILFYVFFSKKLNITQKKFEFGGTFFLLPRISVIFFFSRLHHPYFRKLQILLCSVLPPVLPSAMLPCFFCNQDFPFLTNFPLPSFLLLPNIACS